MTKPRTGSPRGCRLREGCLGKNARLVVHSIVRRHHRRAAIVGERGTPRLSVASDMHPGPMNRGVEIASEVADGPFSVILDQVANGVAVRMAVLYLLAGGVEHEAAA